MSDVINILHVEDNAFDARLFEEIIGASTEGRFSIVSVDCLSDAFKLADRVKAHERIDIILLDLNLPDSSGLNTLARCKELFSDMPIVVLSGVDDESLAIEAVKTGAQDYLVKGAFDYRAIMRTIYHAIERHALWSQLERAEKREHYLATRDPLTGLPNRYSFNEVLSNHILHCERYNERIATVFLDLDRFKTINDSLGHLVGDALLVEVAQRLQSCVRKTDTVARLGGDEFVLILSKINSDEDIARVCENVLKSLAAPVMIQKSELTAGCSMGIAIYPQDGKDFDDLLNNADAAMYSAKGAGGNNYKFYTSELNVLARQRLSIETEMRRAIDNAAFKLVYQPIYNTVTHSLVGVEALVRWVREDGLMMGPDAFIKIAEETGLIVPLGELILREACEQANSWSRKGLPPFSVAVNVSARQFEQKDFISSLSRVFEETSLDTNRLVFELTEHVVMSDAGHTIKTLNELKDMGIHLAIDDFGTGYSSLSYLNQFPIDTLKIDKSFIQNLGRSRKDYVLIAAIVAMAHSLGLEITAEGVETLHQYQATKELGCDRIQGFYLERPMSADSISDLFKGDKRIRTSG